MKVNKISLKIQLLSNKQPFHDPTVGYFVSHDGTRMDGRQFCELVLPCRNLDNNSKIRKIKKLKVCLVIYFSLASQKKTVSLVCRTRFLRDPLKLVEQKDQTASNEEKRGGEMSSD